MTEHICPRCGYRWDCGIDCGIKEVVGCGRAGCIGIIDKLESEKETASWWDPNPNLKVIEIKFAST